jgi:hypothetical protein
VLRAAFQTLIIALATVSPVHLRADGRFILSGRDGRGHNFDISWLRGEVVAITFASRYTREQVSYVNEALLQHMRHGESEVITVVDLVGVPKIAYGYVRRRVAQADQLGRIRHLIDDGRIRQQLQVRPEHDVDILVVDKQGVLRGRYSGGRQLGEALQLIEKLRSNRSE